MKKVILTGAAVGAVCLFLAYLLLSLPLGEPGEPAFRTRGKQIERCEDGVWTPFEIMGVNLGTGYPGVYPNEYGIPDETYDRWFEMIGEMNANTIRVYKQQSPGFYKSLIRYNESHEEKLYLLQNIDFPEAQMFSEENILDPQVQKDLFREACHLVDVLHGDCVELDRENGALHIYSHDVSPYVIGYILGIEWDELFVEYICRLNAHVEGYEGDYLRCGPEANAFEVFLAQWGDALLSYEAERYGEQRLLAFCNWGETDPLDNEIPVKSEGGRLVDELEAFVDADHIHATEELESGTFAAYNLYPYYPLFFQYGPYTEYVDENGDHNPYRKYLMALVDHHEQPVVVTEYGVPASRSSTYTDMWRGFSHGGLSEREQGEAISALYDDIRAAGCAGSLVFTWQDEWYKRAWNEMLLSDPDQRALWSNAQCVEQLFGLLAFEPGKEGETPYPDGDLSDWEGAEVVFDQDGKKLRMQSDEKYVYFLAEGLDREEGHALVNLALDVTPKTGENVGDGQQFNRPVDFIVKIMADGTGGLYVDRHYDMLPYSAFSVYRDNSVSGFLKLKRDTRELALPLDEESDFRLLVRADDSTTSDMVVVPYPDREIPVPKGISRVGLLKAGNGNPASPDFDSNADFFVGEDSVELRIPWQLLNFYDPAGCRIIDDPKENDYRIEGLEIEEIWAAPYWDGQPPVTEFGTYALEGWTAPEWHERKKESYYAVQDRFGKGS